MQISKEKYSSYKAVDFAKDIHFIGWRLSPDESNNKFWTDFQNEYPACKPEIIQAIRILQSTKLNQCSLSLEEKKEELTKLEVRIRNNKRKVILLRTSYVAAAACLIGALFVLQNLFIKDNQINDTIARGSKVIQLITDEKVSILPRNAHITYRTDGSILISENNNKSQSIKSGRKRNRLIVPRGQRSYLSMPDGSKIWVNSGTEVEFPALMDHNKREVNVSGEIYLEVSKDPKRPFTVKGDNFSVEVLGTKFNISSYPGDIVKRVVLLEGKVKVQSSNNQSLILDPNQMAAITKNNLTVHEVDAYNYISWKDGVLTLNSQPLSDVVDYLERYYGVEIESCAKADRMKCNGKLILTDSIEDVLNSIAMTMPVKIVKKDDKIKICSTD